MPSYVVTGPNRSGESVAAVNISAISQEGDAVQDIDVVNAVRSQLEATDGIESVVAQRYEQVITVI